MPRPRRRVNDDAGAMALVGGLAGALLGRTPGSAAIGAAAGGLLGQGSREVVVPLDLALKQLVEDRKAVFVGFHRVGARGGRLDLKLADAYHFLISRVAENGETGETGTRDAIDDAIYDDLNAQLDALDPARANG